MRGPHAPGSGRESLGSRRQHGKSVTFHEECDVVEFEPDGETDTSCEQQDRHDDDGGFFGIPEIDGESEQAGGRLVRRHPTQSGLASALSLCSM